MTHATPPPPTEREPEPEPSGQEAESSPVLAELRARVRRVNAESETNVELKSGGRR
ncbi:hypothetical protein [Streptomyces sp. NPDC127098]|uniref:hypothetical protein n=1 Tax=Streptomyces sp. NPDC127098 TaxID=3347137 RepID=UPI0036590089